MADTTTSPNMGLPVPTVGGDDGPQYAIDIDSCLAIIDAHDHSSGSGVQITPAGLSITSNLPMVNNNLTQTRTIRFQAQGAPLALAADVGCIYESGVDLYYNDGNGNQVRITQSGSVAGTPGSIANLVSPASASYVAGTPAFVWQSDANTAANMDAGSIILRNLTANSKGLTLAPPNAMGSDYTVTLPALPLAKKIVTMTSGGVLAADYDADNVTTQISANTIKVIASGIADGSTITATANILSVPTGGITATQLASDAVTTVKILDANVTRAKLAAVGQQISSSCGAFSFTSSAFANVTNLSCTLTTTGRPVIVALIPDGSTGNGSRFDVGSNGLFVRLLRGASEIARVLMSDNSGVLSVPSLGSWVVDPVAAGTYTYVISVASRTNGVPNSINNMKLCVYEL